MRKILAKLLIPDISRRIEREILIERKRCTRIADRDKYEMKIELDEQRRRDLQEMGGRVKSLEREIHSLKQQTKRLRTREEQVKRNSTTLNWILAEYATVAQRKINDDIDAERRLIGLSNEAFQLVKKLESSKE